mmetsp:Transcript_4491/g.16402  ORF Transcript_4491/g.16402 Transcript_4491/m.16402 type:complete len:598 (-) Transcript_4491:651-2444(-)
MQVGAELTTNHSIMSALSEEEDFYSCDEAGSTVSSSLRRHRSSGLSSLSNSPITSPSPHREREHTERESEVPKLSRKFGTTISSSDEDAQDQEMMGEGRNVHSSDALENNNFRISLIQRRNRRPISIIGTEDFMNEVIPSTSQGGSSGNGLGSMSEYHENSSATSRQHELGHPPTTFSSSSQSASGVDDLVSWGVQSRAERKAGALEGEDLILRNVKGHEATGSQHFEIRHIRNASNDSTDSKSSSRSSSSSASQNATYSHRNASQQKWKLGWRSWRGSSSFMDGTNQSSIKSMFRVWTSTIDPSVSSDGAIWCIKFDVKGEFVATGGQSGIICIWEVELHQEDGQLYRNECSVGLKNRLFCRYIGHLGPILDMSWSRDSLLASASVDQTVRLWHFESQQALRVFNHKDFVTSVVFHPINEKFIITGCLDGMVRMFDLKPPSGSLGKNVSQADTKGVVTALAISEDGETLVAGLFEGKCIFYHLLMKEMKIEDERGKSIASIKSTKGKNSRGHKITGLQYYGKGKKHDSNAKLLVTTVDSRIRLYRAQDMMLLCKYRGGKVTGEVNKGETSMSTQISATISHDFSLLASGSGPPLPP